jgi:fibronectin-binding autotransporter adhesin
MALNSDTQNATLAAAEATNVDFTIKSHRRVFLVIRNTGATNAIGTTVVSVSPNGTYFGALAAVGTAVGSIAASSSSGLIEIPVHAKTLRVTLTSADGSTAVVEMSGDETDGDGSIRVDGSVVGVTSAGALSATTLAVSGATTLNGAVTLGDAAADDVTFSGVVAGSVSLKKEAAHTISIAASTTADTAGGALTIAAGAAAATNANGGALTLDAGALAGSGTGGAITIGGTAANSIALGRTGKTTTVSGNLTVAETVQLSGNTTIGNAATDTLTVTAVVATDVTLIKEVNHTVSVGASTTADTAGANLTIAAGAAAATNANGGNLVLDGGALAGSGTGGTVSLGATSANSVTIGRTGKTTTIPGALAVTEGTTLTGAVGVGGAVATSALLSVTSTTLGFLFPRMTEAQRDAIASPAAGLVVYNTTTNKLNLRVAAAWEVITSA